MCRLWITFFVLGAIGLFCPRPATAALPTTLTIGHLNNPNDPTNTSFGSVGYFYRIGTYEVTNDQYVEFLNAKAASDPLALWNPQMSTNPNGGITRAGSPGSFMYEVKDGMGNQPVVFVSWYDAVRFTNWLHNGQGSGSTESGAYALAGNQMIPTNASSIVRDPGAKWFLPTDDEWYKAAYYQPTALGGDPDSYWDYATRTNAMPYSDQPPGSDAPVQSNSGNVRIDDGNSSTHYNDGYAVTGAPALVATQDYLTDVGAYTQSTSFFGTFDQSDNVSEWNETFDSGTIHRLQGGSWLTVPIYARLWSTNVATFEDRNLGFRVAAVPEPSTLILAVLGAVGARFCRARRPSTTR